MITETVNIKTEESVSSEPVAQYVKAPFKIGEGLT